MTCRGCFRAFSLFLWLELIGFDNTLPDFGVDRYLSRMERKPDAISLLMDNDRLFRSYEGAKRSYAPPKFLLPECTDETRLPNGRLGIFARNNTDTYRSVQFMMHNCVSDVQVHSDFPSLPVKTVLDSRVAPRDTIFFSVGEGTYPLPDAVRR